ncbi:hypothetical protein F4804DRAFT_348127 [Jackrogersella minutella]|nr:hypothetical protein F4804DRAFT_348127 [Jackrogersella minutella]
MSIFCCYRGRRTSCREPGRDEQDKLDTLELPTHPPRAKLSSSQFPTSELDFSSSNIAAVKAPSLLHSSIPEATVDPTILEVEDSDDDELGRSVRNSSTGTLEAIRTRLIRPLSQKSESRRHSQQYLGTSDEEIARRAELKRLMHKRIQEELKSEEEQEEAVAKTNNLDEPKPDSSSNVGLPGGGPRDNIEFSVSDANEIASKDSALGSPNIVLLALPSSVSQPQISLRRSSYSGSPKPSHESSIPKSHGTPKEQGPLPQFPSSPQLTPVHLPSARGSESLCSWRLSYSAEQLANYIGPPDDPSPSKESEPTKSRVGSEADDEEDEDHEHSIESSSSSVKEPTESLELTENSYQHEPTPSCSQHRDPSIIETPEDPCTENSNDEGSGQNSPLDIWLRSQELQSTSAVSSRRTSGLISQMALDSFDPNGQRGPSEDLGEGQKPAKNVPDNLDNSSTTCQSPQNARALPCSSRVGTGIESAQVPISWSDGLQQSSQRRDDSPDGINPSSADYAQDIASSYYASSRYTNRPNSGQAPEKESRLSLIELLGGRKAIPPFANFNRLISPSRTTDAEKSDISSYKTAPNDASALDVTMCDGQDPRTQVGEDSSVAVSDTASFKQREAELKSIEKRFTQVHHRRDITTPTSSKFREEFNEPRTSIITKSSIFAKLHLPIPKRAKHPTKDLWRYSMYDAKFSSAESPNVKIGHFSQQLVTSDTDQKHEDMGSVIGLRQQTRMLEDILGTRQDRGNSPVSLKYPEIINPVQPGSSNKAARVTSVPSLKARTEHGQNLKPPCRHEDNNSPQSDISNNVLREWVNMMNDQDNQLQVETKIEPQSHGPRRSRTPPASWAKWPSHTRHERTGPAGKEDDVIQRDFAIQEGPNGNAMTWSTDKSGESSKRYITPGSRSLSAQLGKAVKGSLNKVVQRNSSEIYRGHQKPDGHLEYPELEILPMQGGYEELQVLEQQIGTMKRRSVTLESQAERLSSDNMRPPLSMRFAEEVHIMQHRVSRDSCQDDDDIVPTLPAVSPMTPRQILLGPQGPSDVIDRFETPESHVSYEDCVPKHMLEDEGPVDTDTTTAEEGHNMQA